MKAAGIFGEGPDFEFYQHLSGDILAITGMEKNGEKEGKCQEYYCSQDCCAVLHLLIINNL